MSAKIWYETPATEPGWLNKDTSLLPIGNGYMAALISGRVFHERLQFNEESLWTGGPGGKRRDSNNGDGEDYYFGYKKSVDMPISSDELLAAMKNGSFTNDMMQGLLGTSDGYGSYQNFGWLNLEFLHGDVCNYRRELDLETAIASVTYTADGTTYKRKYFASYPDRAIILKISADNPVINLNISVDSAHANAETAYVTSNQSAYITLDGKISDNGMQYAAHFNIGIDKGGIVASENNISIQRTDCVTIIFSAATNYINEFRGLENSTYRHDILPGDLAAGFVICAAKKDYDSLFAAHVADYKSLFKRVSVDIGGGVDFSTDELIANYGKSHSSDRTLEELLFQYGRYLLIASSRPGTLPANLQGKWNLENEPPWSADYHYNINLQMTYWPAGITNLPECTLPLIDFIENLVSTGEITAQKYNGVDTGWTLHTSGNIFGFTAPGWGLEWGWSPANNAFICQNLWDYYAFTGDIETLKHKIYPIIKGAALFWVNALKFDGDSLVAVPSLSPEHGPVTYATAYDQQLIWELFDFTIRAINELDATEDYCLKAELAKKKLLLNPVEIGSMGQIMEWRDQLTDYDDRYDIKHRHISQLVGLYPGTLINRQTLKFLEAARATLNRRGDGATGWSMGWKINFWARVFDGNRAHSIIKNLIQENIATNLFGLHELVSPRHYAFQLDANMGYTAGFAELLVQSGFGYIDILPALPDVWSVGKVSGLKVRGGHAIDICWSEKHLDINIVPGTNSDEVVLLHCYRFKNINATINGVMYSTSDDSTITLNIKTGEIDHSSTV